MTPHVNGLIVMCISRKHKSTEWDWGWVNISNYTEEINCQILTNSFAVSTNGLQFDYTCPQRFLFSKKNEWNDEVENDISWTILTK